MKQLPALLLFLHCCCFCTAQTNTTPELHLNYLTVKDGLPEGTAAALLQDKEGYIWMGTQDGLVRYDGYKPKTYILGADIPYKKGITRLYEDKSGALWAGTYSQGLFYYERGKDKFIHIVSSIKSDSLSSATVGRIQEDASGNLWVGTLFLKRANDVNDASRVYFLINVKTKKCKRFDITNTAGWLFRFTQDKNGTLWFGSFNGIYNYDYSSNKLTGYYTAADSSQKRYFINGVQDPAQPGFIWMGYGNTFPDKPGGVCRFNMADKSITIYKHEAKDSNSISGNKIGPILIDSAHRLWFATENGLSLYHPATNNFSNYVLHDEYKKADGDSIYDFKQDKAGNFWCSTNSGLVYFNTKTKSFTRYTASEKQEDGLLGNYIYSTLIGRNGTLWFGGGDQLGLEWINKGRSKYIVYQNNPAQLHYFPGGGVNAFAEAPDGSFWLAATHGLYHWLPQKDSFAVINLDKTQSSDVAVSAVAIDKEGWIWCGVPENKTNIKGLYSYNPANGVVKNYRNIPSDTASLPDNNIVYLLSDHTGLLWIGTNYKGVCYFTKQSQKFTVFGFKRNGDDTLRVSDKLDDNYVQSLYEDREGNIWIGTNSGGLNKYNRQTGSFSSFQNNNIGLACPIGIYEDNKGRLWAGSFSGYLFQFDENMRSFKTIAKTNYISGIRQDNDNNLWVYSTNGINILDSNKNQLRPLREVPGIPYISIFKTSSGLFLLGIKGGFISLNPDAFLPDTIIPTVHIETVAFKVPQKNSIYSKDSSIVRYGKNKIGLRYDENRVTFSYVGLLYQNTALVQYAYKLDGYDKGWVQAGTQRTVTYTNLSPGKYKFHVKAANADGVWSINDDSITLIISPPWWQTWWAYLLFAIIAVIAVWGFVAYRSKALKKHNKILEHKVQLRTAEVLEQKEELAAQRDHLEETLQNLQSTQAQLIQSEKMASLGELTAGIAHEIQNPLNFVNNFSEVNKEMIAEMKEEIDNGNYEEVKLIANNIEDNEEKINHHGKRADSIVKGMLQHSRKSSGEKEPTDINALVDEFLRLSYHGLRAKDKSFNATMETNFDETIGKINIVPQDIGRVLLNLFNNAFYAVSERSRSEVNERLRQAQPGSYYEPAVSVSTKKIDNKVEIKVKDNGNGIPKNVIDKIFQPFFTTKPAGSGTGLGLSLSYDIIKAHRGEIKVESKEGEGTEFIIQLPGND